MAERAVQIRLTADGTGFVGEVRLAEQETDKFAESMAKLGGQVKIALTMLTGYAAVAAYGIKQVVEQQDAVGKLSQVYGIQIEQLSAYSHMAKLANISNEELALGLRNLIKNVDEAAANRGDGGRIFQALGLSVNGKGLDQVLGEVADKFASFKDGPEKAALALQLFGRSGERLIPMLNQGSAGIAAVKAEAERLGITFGGDTTRLASEFVDNMTRLNATFTATKMAIAVNAVPALNALMERFLLARREGDNFFSSMFKGVHGFLGGGDRELAERSLADATEQRLALQNDLMRLSGVGGSAAARGRASIPSQIAALDEKIAQARALLAVTDKDFFKGPPGEKKDATRVLDLTQEKQLLNQLQDQYAQLTGQVNIYESVQRKMTETGKQFDPVLRNEIEGWARKIDAMRTAQELAQAAMAQEADRQRQVEEFSQFQAQLDQMYLGIRAGTVRETEQAGIGSISDPVVRAKQQLEAERRYRDEAVFLSQLDDHKKRDLYDRNAEWYVARQAQLNEELKPEYQKNLDAWSDNNRLMRDSWNSTMLAVQKTGEDMFVQFVTTGKLQIQDLARVIEAELARSFYRGAVGAASSGGVGGLFSYLTGGGSAPNNAQGGDYGAFLHAGGVVGEAGMPMRSFPRGTFRGAPRMHSGLAADEFPAILQRGETVLPRGTSSSVVHAPLHIYISAPGAGPGTETAIRSMLHTELPGLLYKHRRALVGLLNDYRRESGRESL